MRVQSTADTTPLYAELPLSSDRFQTRILELETRSEEPESGIVNCTLRTFDLEDALEFSALSYCWGDQVPDRIIRVNGEEVLVTPNLESALKHLRRASERRLLWVDAICINQTDVDERNAQVARMHTIYQKAERTIA